MKRSVATLEEFDKQVRKHEAQVSRFNESAGAPIWSACVIQNPTNPSTFSVTLHAKGMGLSPWAVLPDVARQALETWIGK